MVSIVVMSTIVDVMMIIVNPLIIQDQIEYSLVEDSPETDYFYMHPEVGSLSLVKPFSREAEKVSYRVGIE